MQNIEQSLYQSIKGPISDMLHLSHDAIHVHLGIAVFFFSVLVWNKGRIVTKCLFPVVGIAFLMEVLDWRDDLRSLGYLRLSEGFYDMINTIFWPTILVLWAGLSRSCSKISAE